MDITTGHNAHQRGFDPVLADAPPLDVGDPGYREARDGVLQRAAGITDDIHVMPDVDSLEPGTLSLATSGGQYLVVMYLDESEHGAGTGSAFCDIAHRVLDASGSPYTLLSYAVANPRSGPFWSRMGYRPIVTEWKRRPAALAI